VKRFHHILKSLCTAVLVMFMGFATPAQAVAPANAVLEVEVSVTIGGAVLEQESPSFSGVKVNLIPSEPTVAGTGAVAFEGDSATLTYTITATANGFDTYTLTPALGTLDGVTGTPSLALSQNSVGLGATAVLSVSGAEVTVPFDGNADNAINGIVPGQNVVIGGQALTVVGITDTAETSKIQLSEPLGSTPQGTLIAESRSVTVTIADVGSLADTATPGSIPVTLSVRSDAGETSWDGLGEALVMVEAVVSASVELYARYLDGRVPTASSTGGEVLTLTYPQDAGQTYYKSGSVELSAAPEATVEYLMVFNAGSAEREEVVLRASTSSFLEYVPGSARLNNNGLDDRQGSCDVDYWCTDDNSLAVGTVGANDTYYAVFQMKVSDGAVSSSASAASTSSSSTTSATTDPDPESPGVDTGGTETEWLTGGPAGECRYNEDGVWAPNMDWEKCKGVKWNAANGEELAINPICWSRNVPWGLGSYQSPWVVGRARPGDYASSGEARSYDCRITCAQHSTGIEYCARRDWWHSREANNVTCTTTRTRELKWHYQVASAGLREPRNTAECLE
jgi:hypothetical protein